MRPSEPDSRRMKVLEMDPARPDPRMIAEAAAILAEGGLVAFPTETVYGLGANALDAGAVRRIFAAKGRPAVNPLIAHCASVDAAREITSAWPDAAERLAAAFWPGPLTLVLPKRAMIPDAATAGLPSVAVRVPANPIALALLQRAGFPIVAPSANRYTELSPTRAEHVIRGLDNRVDLVLNGGPTRVGIESTVVDLTAVRPVLLRPGIIDRDRLEAVLGEPVATPDEFEEDAPRPSPGLSRRHYAPRAALVVVPAAEIPLRIEAARAAGQGVAVLGFGRESAVGTEATVRMPADPEGYAAALYSQLHWLDEAGCDVVVVEEPPAGTAWDAIRDRLRRGASRPEST